jgi:ubiquinol-cytochrome c reductase cytochrome b subunit
MQLGAKHVESPFIEFGQISTVLYFLYFTVVMYGVTTVENTFVDIAVKSTTPLPTLNVSK